MVKILTGKIFVVFMIFCSFMNIFLWSSSVTYGLVDWLYESASMLLQKFFCEQLFLTITTKVSPHESFTIYGNLYHIFLWSYHICIQYMCMVYTIHIWYKYLAIIYNFWKGKLQWNYLHKSKCLFLSNQHYYGEFTITYTQGGISYLYWSL